MFSCKRIQHIWLKIGIVFKLDIKWKHVVLGLNEASYINNVKNNIITIISYAIYTSWLSCDENKDNYKFVNVSSRIKNYIVFYKQVYGLLNFKKQWFTLFNTLLNGIHESL